MVFIRALLYKYHAKTLRLKEKVGYFFQKNGVKVMNITKINKKCKEIFRGLIVLGLCLNKKNTKPTLINIYRKCKKSPYDI